MRRSTTAALSEHGYIRRRRGIRTGSRFLPHFVSFQGFAGRKISASISRPIASSVRPAFGQGRKRRLRSCRTPTLCRLAPCALTRAVAQGSSSRSERCRRGSCAGSATRKVKRVDPKTLTRIRFIRKKKSTKIYATRIQRRFLRAKIRQSTSMRAVCDRPLSTHCGPSKIHVLDLEFHWDHDRPQPIGGR